MNEEKLEKLVSRIFDKMDALPKKYSQMTVRCDGTSVTFLVRSIQGKIAVPVSMVRKPFIVNFQFMCSPEDYITKAKVRENIKDIIRKSDERLRKAKSEKFELFNKE